jgi:hypothetical protein
MQGLPGVKSRGGTPVRPGWDELIQARVERSGAPLEMAAEELSQTLDALAARCDPDARTPALTS